MKGRIQNMDRGPWTTPWTTPNFQQEIAPVNIKLYRRSGYMYKQKHRLIFITYVHEGLSRNRRVALGSHPINGKTTNLF